MIHIKESAPYDARIAPGDNYGKEYMARISKKTASGLCGMYPLPEMGCETVVALASPHKLYVANLSGDYFVRCHSADIAAWPDVFGVTVERCKE